MIWVPFCKYVMEHFRSFMRDPVPTMNRKMITVCRLIYTEGCNALSLAWKVKLAHHFAELNVDYQIM
jgi:hypothetical protein